MQSNGHTFPHLPADIISALDGFDAKVEAGSLQMHRGFITTNGPAHPEVWVPQYMINMGHVARQTRDFIAEASSIHYTH